MTTHYQLSQPRLRWGEIGSLIICALVGSAASCGLLAISIVLMGDSLSIARTQSEARKFPTATGRVIRSSVQTEQVPGSKAHRAGTEYWADIGYQYEVGGRTYTGDRVYHEPNEHSWEPGAADALVASFPKGSEVVVFYSPREPAVALIQPGMIDSDVFVLIPCAFLALGCCGLSCFWRWWRNRFLRLNTGCVKVIVRDSCMHAKLATLSPLASTLGVTGVLFLAMHALFFKLSSHPRSPGAVLAGVVPVLIASAAVFRWARSRWDSGVDDLVIDRNARTITLPRKLFRRRNITVELSTITSLELVKVSGGRKAHFCPTLSFSDPELEPVRLANWQSLRRGDAFVCWLEKQIGLDRRRGSWPFCPYVS